MPPATSRSRATGRVTLADVATLAGVSPMTVSRALSGARAVDPALVQRVQAAAAKLGYVPDPAAQALASRRSTHVALLLPMLSNALFVDLLEAAREMNINISQVCDTHLREVVRQEQARRWRHGDGRRRLRRARRRGAAPPPRGGAGAGCPRASR